MASAAKRERLHRHPVGHEGVEEPLLLRIAAGAREVLAELAQLLARLDAEFDAAVPQHLAGLALVHLGVDVERREQRVERRGRDVLQERFVEALVVDEALLPAQVLVALVDLAGLREAGAVACAPTGSRTARGISGVRSFSRIGLWSSNSGWKAL